jgi:hypothetical protein
MSHGCAACSAIGSLIRYLHTAAHGYDASWLCWPASLSLAPQPDMDGELEPVRIGPDTADRSLRTSTTWAGTDPGITASERIHARRRRRAGSAGSGCGIDSKKLTEPH